MAQSSSDAPVLLAPSEYVAEAGTAVGGRVVLARLFKIKSKGKSKGGEGKGKGKYNAEKESDVCEQQ